jgi:hypothetical protein
MTNVSLVAQVLGLELEFHNILISADPMTMRKPIINRRCPKRPIRNFFRSWCFSVNANIRPATLIPNETIMENASSGASFSPSPITSQKAANKKVIVIWIKLIKRSLMVFKFFFLSLATAKLK